MLPRQLPLQAVASALIRLRFEQSRKSRGRLVQDAHQTRGRHHEQAKKLREQDVASWQFGQRFDIRGRKNRLINDADL